MNRSWLEEKLFGDPPLEIYALLRIIVGGLAFAMLLNSWGEAIDLYSNLGFFPLEARQTVGRDTGFSLLAFSDGPTAVTAVYVLALVFSLSYALGLFTPVSGWGLFLAWISISNRNTAAAAGDELLVGMMLFPLLFSPSGGLWSLDRRIRGLGLPEWGNRIPLRLLQLQLCVAYFYSGFFKAMGDEWIDGSAALVALMNPGVRRVPFDFWLHPWLLVFFKLFTWAVILWELLFPLLVLHPLTRKLALGFGLTMHTTQFLTVDTGAFALLMMSLYLTFCDPDWLRRLLKVPAPPGPDS